jgi:hypothetical protein
LWLLAQFVESRVFANCVPSHREEARVHDILDDRPVSKNEDSPRSDRTTITTMA